MPPVPVCHRRRAASPIPPASSWAPIGSDLARPGAALYGINPTPGAAEPDAAAGAPDRARPGGARHRSRASCRLQRHLARRPPIAASPPLGIGYADGWHRACPACGRRVSLTAPRSAGRPCLHGPDHLRCDRPSRRAAGNWLELIGPHRSADDVAERRRHQRLRGAHRPRPPLSSDLPPA